MLFHPHIARQTGPRSYGVLQFRSPMMPKLINGGIMATNTKKGFRRGSVDERSQLDLDPKRGKFVKRDLKTGRFMDLKGDDKPFKGVAKEPDGRK